MLGPLSIDHCPVPTDGLFALSVFVPVAQIAEEKPAFEVVGWFTTVTVIG